MSGLAVEKRTRGVISMSHDRHFTLGSAAAYTPQVLTYSLFVSTVLSDHRKGLHRTKLCLTPLGKCAYEAGTKWGLKTVRSFTREKSQKEGEREHARQELSVGMKALSGRWGKAWNKASVIEKTRLLAVCTGTLNKLDLRPSFQCHTLNLLRNAHLFIA